MGRLTNLAANTALMSASAWGYWAWRQATGRVAETQQAVLRNILRRNWDTSFGQEHRFRHVTSAADYQRLVPLRSYDDFEPYVQRVAQGESKVLTAEPVAMFEPSSGSTAASKLVPYTRSLQQEFQRGISPWLYQTFTTWPGLLTGRQYWSITPAASARSFTAGGIPIGFEEDSQYFGALRQRVVGTVMAVPPGVERIPDLETFRYLTLRFLLQAGDLSLISVWNPTYLTLLLQALLRHQSALVSDLAQGTLNPPDPKSPQSPFEKGGSAGILDLLPYLKRDPKRANRLATVLDAWNGCPGWRDHRGRSGYEAIWPNLKLISCWADGPASEYAANLQQLFPNTVVQPKGLLATEGFVSLPLGRRSGAALSITSHFFEFLNVQGDTNTDLDALNTDTVAPLLAHQLRPGEVYSVVITTSGGLYRYRLHDLVEVTGFVGQCPVLRFLGKEDGVVDLFGEKLHEAHVRRAVKRQFARHRLAPDFWLVAPVRDGSYSAHYTLFVQWQSPHGKGLDESWGSAPTEESLQVLGATLERELQQNYHYKYCRELGQLHPLEVFLIDADSMDASSRFLETCNALGQRLGGVKPTGLHPYQSWGNVFPGRRICS